jgi:CRISPR-associated protein Csh1
MQDRVEDVNYDNLTAEEFFYISGQVAKYLINQSEAFQKKGDILEPYLRANSVVKLKKVIENVFYMKKSEKE